MKKIKILILLISLLLVGCDSNNTEIEKLDNKAKNENCFIMISLTKLDIYTQGRVLMRINNNIYVYSLMFDATPFDLLNMSLYELKKSAEDYLIIDEITLMNNEYIEKSVFYKNNEKRIQSSTFPVGKTRILNNSVWAVESFAGFNIPEEHLNLVRYSKVKLDNKEWDIIKGSYNLGVEVSQIVGDKGTYQLWYNDLERTVYEIYKGSVIQRYIIRRIWFGEEGNFLNDEADINTIIEDFYRYLKNSNFENIKGVLFDK